LHITAAKIPVSINFVFIVFSITSLVSLFIHSILNREFPVGTTLVLSRERTRENLPREMLRAGINMPSSSVALQHRLQLHTHPQTKEQHEHSELSFINP
jgi:hypothetical protein